MFNYLITNVEDKLIVKHRFIGIKPVCGLISKIWTRDCIYLGLHDVLMCLVAFYNQQYQMLFRKYINIPRTVLHLTRACLTRKSSECFIKNILF